MLIDPLQIDTRGERWRVVDLKTFTELRAQRGAEIRARGRGQKPSVILDDKDYQPYHSGSRLLCWLLCIVLNRLQYREFIVVFEEQWRDLSDLIGSMSMNIFRLAGDMSHVFSILVLLLRLRVAKNAQGIVLPYPAAACARVVQPSAHRLSS